MNRRLNILTRTEKFSCFLLDQSILTLCVMAQCFSYHFRKILSFLAVLKFPQWRNIHGKDYLLIFIPAKQFCLLINESPAKLCLWQGRQPGYTPIVKTMERTRICGSFLLTLTWGFMGLRSLAKAKLSVLFENILNICNHNGFAVTRWDCEQQRSPEEARTALKWQIKKTYLLCWCPLL